jgi:hypothetical protein
MKTKNVQEAKKHLEKLCELVAKRPSPFRGMTKDEVIEKLRETREKLWEKKLGVHT